MSLIAPLWLAAAAVVGAGVVFAHLFSTTIPPQNVLPTVRFIPEGTPLTVLRTRRITDWWLLLLRLAAVALLGLALSGVHLTRSAPPRVVLLDVSRAVGSPAAALDSALAAAQSGAELVAFDSSAKRMSDREARALRTTPSVSRSRGSLSAAIVAAHRLLAETPDGGDRTELVIVSPLVNEEVDSATARLLALWPGSIRRVRVAPATDSARARIDVRADGDDPVVAALASLAGSWSKASNATVRLVRVQPTHADSQWAQSTGGVLVIWPAANQASAAPDSQRGIATSHHVSIAPYHRERSPHPGQAIVRWTDGEPAATETALGRGCVRDVAVPVDAVGDVALRDSFRGIAQSLVQPCGGTPDLTPADFDSLRAAGARSAQPGGTRRLADQERLADVQTPVGGLPLALAIVAFGLLIVEQFLRVRSRAAA